MMHGPLPDQKDLPGAATSNPLVAALGQALALCNNVIVFAAALALIACAGLTMVKRAWRGNWAAAAGVRI